MRDFDFVMYLRLYFLFYYFIVPSAVFFILFFFKFLKYHMYVLYILPSTWYPYFLEFNFFFVDCILCKQMIGSGQAEDAHKIPAA